MHDDAVHAARRVRHSGDVQEAPEYRRWRDYTRQQVHSPGGRVPRRMRQCAHDADQ
jgi:hypothetical protein